MGARHCKSLEGLADKEEKSDPNLHPVQMPITTTSSSSSSSTMFIAIILMLPMTTFLNASS
eukprot:2687260-Rhodomonas_salina.3